MSSWSSGPCMYTSPAGVRCYNSVGLERTYCAQHKQPAWFNPNRPKASKTFIRNRPIVVARDKGLCQMPVERVGGLEPCGKLGAEVDHIMPLAAGGTDDLYNLRYLCESCHKAKTSRDNYDNLQANKPRKK